MSRTLFLLLLLALPARAVGPAVSWSYERDVRPVLRAHCMECHGETGKPKGGLDLRLRRFAVAAGAVLPGSPEKSPLYLRAKKGEMPPGKAKLSAREVEALRGWIAAGAPVGRAEPAKIPPGVYFTDDDRSHWAFRPLWKGGLPQDQGGPIDRFLKERLRRAGLSLAPPADRYTLIRRLKFALTGLPPTPEEVKAFIADRRPDAYERLVDHFLASPAYGERWGRHWLDVAGYADSHGYTGADPVRPYAWKYRDWVVRALNADKPLDEFIVEQLAGDELVKSGGELSAGDVELLTATGFLRTAPDGTASPGADRLEAGNQHVADTLQIVGTALLGLTVQCAQCHNHRYDPIPQADYYRMRAVLEPALGPSAARPAGSRLRSLLSAAGRATSARIEREAGKIDRERLGLQAKHIERVFKLQLARVPEKERAAAEAAYRAKKRTAAQEGLLRRYPFVNVTAGSLYLYDGKAAKELAGLAEKAAKLRASKPVEDFIDVLAESPGKVPPTRVFHRGDPTQPGEVVGPGLPAILGLPEIPAKGRTGRTTGRRLAFARLLVGGKHPLTARVLANRVWMHHFGRGLAANPADFGALGQAPTHPELLDYLAGELMRGWSLKRLHRLIVTSEAFRQGWRGSALGRRVDPENRLLWRAPVRRLEAEAVRDSMLAASGRLFTRVGGPPVPVMPDEAGRVVLGVDLRDGAGYPRGKAVDLRQEQYRRSLYVQARRSRVLSVLEAFDAAQPAPCTEKRNASTAPQQALLLMNSQFVALRSADVAARLAPEAGLRAKVRRAWWLVYGRPPDADDVAGAVAYLRRQAALTDEKTALQSFCQALLASNRFLYVD